MTITIPEQEIAETFGVISQACNSAVGESMDALAEVVKPLQGESELADEVYENCKKVQTMYNDGGFVDSLQKLLSDFNELDCIREYLEKKASVGDITTADTGFRAGSIDASAVTV